MRIIIILLFQFFSSIFTSKCRDGVHNVITIDSYGNETLPIEIRNITIHVYDHQMKPSCYKKHVNVVMPGYFVIKGGEVDTSRDFDVVKDGAVSVSVSLDGDHICLNGRSDMFIVPDSLCSFQMSTFVPVDICRTLEKKGLHTLQELQGDYHIKISISSEKKKIVEFAIPTGYTALKMGLDEKHEED